MEFDWVTARASCSLGGVFDGLLEGVRHDVATRNKQAGPVRLEFSAEPNLFRVSATKVATGAVTRVEFRLTPQAIEVAAPDGGTPTLSATVILGDDGVCRLKVGDGELLPWQFRKRALERLMFD
jgi:hypothetical protein